MQLIDWLEIGFPLILAACIMLYARRYMKSVADFLSGRRLAGRYLLAVASGEMQAGAVVFAASFERIAKSGFALHWWSWLLGPIGICVAISGFVGYRFRETRALTLAQFFEIRYSKNFRLFTGVLAFLAGLTNFGIIPAVGSRVLVYFLGLPDTLHFHSFSVPTYVPLMAVFLCITMTLALTGGIITVMVTDCLEGIFSQVFYIIIIACLLMTFKWSDISAVMAQAPPRQSMLNPFDISGLKDFNLFLLFIGLVTSIYGTGSWQNASAYKSASLTPHEGRMGGLLGQWRELGKASVITLLAICGMTYLQHPHFAEQSAAAHSAIEHISNPQIQKQMSIPVAISYMLPTGVKGLLCAVMLMGIFGGDATHLHSWSSIFVQDVLVPLREKPFSPEEHIRILRIAIIGVAVFAFVFGTLFRQTEYIFMWWAVTQAIYMGGAGAAIIGGLYWKKGTTAGAWSGMLTGSILAVGGIIARQIYGNSIPNGAIISFYAMAIGFAVYILVSLATCREDFNLDRMLHRGKYAVINQLVSEPAVEAAPAKKGFFGKLVGFDKDFTKWDKFIAGGLLTWSGIWITVMIVGTIWNMFSPWPMAVWSQFWHIVSICIPVVITVVTGIWFTWGGLRDIRRLFQRLATTNVNMYDDGTVAHHHNLDEEMLASPNAPVSTATKDLIHEGEKKDS